MRISWCPIRHSNILLWSPASKEPSPYAVTNCKTFVQLRFGESIARSRLSRRFRTVATASPQRAVKKPIRNHSQHNRRVMAMRLQGRAPDVSMALLETAQIAS
ncbi:hypothetical protein DPMN_026656 [Dreissena polymorpha]|uniref:Uncharacterized protein n=1 Tax=Dreissena polymorpha TaxID=45954 RepID=A0A9D4LTT0_DREPO|nr:hypothetical protein DPMN_026656 [Dreissena polymorpha]